MPAAVQTVKKQHHLSEALYHPLFNKVFEGVNVKLSEESFTGNFLQKVPPIYNKY